MIAREKILVAMPVFNYLIDVGCVSGLLGCWPLYARPYIWAGMSNIALARNEIAHYFVEQSTFEWIMWVDADTRFTPRDWELLWEGDEDIVCAEYARKILGRPPVQFGMGFTRVHRSVYEKIRAMTMPDGRDRAGRFYHNGALMVDYHPNGATPEGKWIGEDEGFFMWAASLDVKMRLETRTRLVHVGQFGYGYPDQIPGFRMLDAEDGAQ